MPAPSPARGSAPTAPRCSRLSRMRQRVLDDLVGLAALDVGDEADAAGSPCRTPDHRGHAPPGYRDPRCRSFARRQRAWNAPVPAAPACLARDPTSSRPFCFASLPTAMAPDSHRRPAHRSFPRHRTAALRPEPSLCQVGSRLASLILKQRRCSSSAEFRGARPATGPTRQTGTAILT